MKQRYTLTIADMELNVVSDDSPETVESLVGSVDRKMREILTTSRRCTKSEAALLCALDYCSDKVQALRKVKQQEALIDAKNTEITALSKENERLKVELETLRESLLAAQSARKEEALSFGAEESAEGAGTPEAAPEAPEQLAIPACEIASPSEAEAVPAAEPSAAEETPVREAIEPEEVEFDPTEIFRRVKANRSLRKGKRK